MFGYHHHHPHSIAKKRNIRVFASRGEAEPAVIVGMSKTIERDRPDIIFEVLPDQGTGPVIAQQLRSLGYKLFLFRDRGTDE